MVTEITFITRYCLACRVVNKCHDVGTQFLDSFDRYFAVLCFAAYFPIAVLLDARAAPIG